ncbi:hypothetical protein AB0G74_27415 [Streptomyces sp. NPDC020875]|uniref:hypothetical protein n=1 Tax=Streptomyces sp. NPDC020875 TaxID=3154898 RepID=UPI0033CADDFF
MSEYEGSAGEVRAPRTPTAPSSPRHSDGAALPGEPPADGLPELLALVGRLLEGHAPAEIAVLLREELDRREIEAYAKGWRDASDEYGPALEEALAAARPLRLVDRTPGRAAVIPFPYEPHDPGAPRARRDSPDSPESRRSRDARDPHASASRERSGPYPGDEATRRRPPEGADGGDLSSPPVAAPDGPAARTGSAAEGDEGPGSAQPRPAFGVKSRKSKVPTIPQLPAPRRPPRDQGGRTDDTPGGAPDDHVG